MALSLQAIVHALALRLRSARFRVLGPLFVLAFLRYVYHRQRRHLEQLRVHCQLNAVLASGHPEDHTLDHRVVEEWHDVGDGVSFGSIVYRPPPTAAKSNVLVVFIPGNPGLPHFYLPLMRDIVRRFGKHHEVRALSHAGHFMPWKNNGKVFDLHHHHEHKIAYLNQRIKENPELKLVLVAHSIGAYLQLKVMKAFPDHIAKAVFMQPTFHHIGKSAKGTQMMPLFRYRHQAVKLVKLLQFLTPLALRRWLSSLAVGSVKEEAFVDISVSLVNHQVMLNVLHMAHQEMQQVGDVDEATLRLHEHKSLIVYSPIDGWVPNEFVQMFQLKFGKARHRVIPQGHGFMVEHNGSRDMADHIALWVADVLQDKQ